MKTNMKRQGDMIIVSVEGRLNYEKQLELRDSLHQLMNDTLIDQSPKKIIFNFENLEFVGSSGISNFVQTLKEVNARSSFRPRYCNVRSEFQKIIRAFDEAQEFEFFETEERARSSFDH